MHWIVLILIACALIAMGRAGVLEAFGALFGIGAFLASPFVLAFIFSWGLEGAVYGVLAELGLLGIFALVMEAQK